MKIDISDETLAILSQCLTALPNHEARMVSAVGIEAKAHAVSTSSLVKKLLNNHPQVVRGFNGIYMKNNNIISKGKQKKLITSLKNTELFVTHNGIHKPLLYPVPRNSSDRVRSGLISLATAIQTDGKYNFPNNPTHVFHQIKPLLLAQLQ